MIETLNINQAVEFLLSEAKKNGADQAEALGVRSTSLSAVCRLQKAELLESAENKGVDLRVFCGKKSVCVSSSVLDKKILSDLAVQAVLRAKAVPDDPYAGLADASTLATDLIDLDLCDEGVLSTDVLLEKALQAESAALDVKGVTDSYSADASFSMSDVFMASTVGFSRFYRRSGASISATVIAQDASGKKERDYDFSQSVYFSDLDSPQTVGEKAGKRTVARMGAKKIDTAVMSVVLDPRIAKSMLGHFLSAINGTSIAKGTSFLKNKMNQSVFGSCISILENPHLKRGLASRPCDAEGLPTKPLTLVKDGILTSWLLDLRSARQLGLPPTGHASRSIGGIAHPSPSNVSFVAGDISPQDIRSDIKSGLYITDLFGQGVNTMTGDYSRGATGFLIENGQITTPVHEITLAGNLNDFFKTMILANDLEYRYALNSPTIRIDRVTIAGK